jgi:hypothetical protein
MADSVAADTELFAALDQVVLNGWTSIRGGRYFTHVLRHGANPDLYRRTMVEVYHYTRHNSINQAVSAYPVDPDETGLLRFCYRHAADELGHEKMVVHDLRAVGLLRQADLQAAPLPPTQALIHYLYSVALSQGAIPRLGYSYWAESAYGHLAELVARMRTDLGLTDREMAFFVAHQSVDTRHAQQVREAIERYARTSEHHRGVLEVAQTTLYLTGAMLDAILDSHLADPQELELSLPAQRMAAAPV